MYSEDYNDEETEEIQSENFFVNFYQNNKILVWILLGIILFIIIMSLLTKGGSNSYTKKDYKVVMEPNADVVVTVGHSIKLYASIEDVPDATFKWTSNNESVAVVDEGTVKGISIGTATITASYQPDPNKDAIEGSVDVVIGMGSKDIVLENVSLPNGSLFMRYGDEYPISLILSPSRGFIENMSFSSSNTSIVTVDNDGNAKAVGVGEAVISYDVNDKFKGSLNVYVDTDYTVSEIIEVPQTISFDGLLKKIKIGEISSLSYTVSPTSAARSKFKWTSSDPNCVSVDSDGNVTGLQIGRSTITVTSVNNITARIDVEVETSIIDVTDIELNTGDMTLVAGETATIVPTITPDDASNKALRYSSSDDTVALIVGNDTGTSAKIHALSKGTAVIYVKSDNGIEKSFVVNVTGQNGGDSGSSGGGGGSSSSGGSGTIKVRVNGDIPTKSCDGQELTYYENPSVSITINGGVSKIKYCYATYKCTPNMTATSSTTFTISGKGMFILRIQKFDSSGNEIASSDGNNYVDGALQYYINTKSKGTKCSSTSKSCGSIGHADDCRDAGCYWDYTGGGSCVNSQPKATSTPKPTTTTKPSNCNTGEYKSGSTCKACPTCNNGIKCFTSPAGSTDVTQCYGTVPAGKYISCSSTSCAVNSCTGDYISSAQKVNYSSSLSTNCTKCPSGQKANSDHTACVSDGSGGNGGNGASGISVEIPTSEKYCKSATYDGTAKTLTNNPPTGVKFTGYMKTEAGIHTITASLNSGYVWSDGTTSNKTFTCEIKSNTNDYSSLRTISYASDKKPQIYSNVLGTLNTAVGIYPKSSINYTNFYFCVDKAQSNGGCASDIVTIIGKARDYSSTTFNFDAIVNAYNINSTGLWRRIDRNASKVFNIPDDNNTYYIHYMLVNIKNGSYNIENLVAYSNIVYTAFKAKK